MSRLPTASTRAAPIPGYENTNSTTTTPPARYASWSAVTWIAGTIAFGTAWRQITVRRGSPFSVAIVTYSLSSTSTIDPRMMRLMYGTTASTSGAAGSTTTWGSFQAFSPGPSSETAGNHCTTSVANTMIRTIPITNSGSEARIREPVETMGSTARSRRIASHTPIPIDSGIATAAEISTRNRELPTRLDSSSLTGAWVAAESPRSRVKIPPSHWRYWLTTGSDRLSWSRSAASRSAVASRPRIACAASPGSASVAANTSSDTSHSVSRPRASRRRTSFAVTRIPWLRHESHRAQLVVAEREARAGLLDARDVPGVRVDRVREVRDDVAALLVLEHLGLVEQLAATVLVELGAGLLDQPLELLVLPVGLIEGRVRQAALRHLGQVGASGPEVLGEGPGQVVVAIERAGVDLAHVHLHAGALRLLGEHLRRLDDPAEDVAGDELDAEVALPRL